MQVHFQISPAKLQPSNLKLQLHLTRGKTQQRIAKMNRDPITNLPLPPNAIQRILYIAQKVHVYRIPPPSSPRYLTAALWTANQADQIFTARLRLVETAIPSTNNEGGEDVSATILLEDANSGELFAAAPYALPTAVEQATDSSRFFAVRVVGQGGMKATLGIGFEERPIAFDFSIALQDVRRTLHLDPPQGGPPGSKGKAASGAQAREEVKRDLSLKDGEMITIKIGGKGRRTLAQKNAGEETGANPFAIAPPPAGAHHHTRDHSSTNAASFVPPLPPPSTSKAADKFSDDGFDDGEFGEFQ
jgi:hypothetical protein